MSGSPESAVHERYLAEAHQELDAMLGEVGTLEAEAEPQPEPLRPNWGRILLVALATVVVLVVGMILLRGRRPARMAVNFR
jgi:hypothetical protein